MSSSVSGISSGWASNTELNGGCAASEDVGAGSLGSDDAEMEAVVDFFFIFLLILALRTL
jgi:hypothetical protein